ncbi:GNAT family N-acetyltransferase [Candidatus Curtissbacteria bacterium]|nr:GNAT family N-acetyltransferase [Candidatus Curtissbacteria bacterium]
MVVVTKAQKADIEAILALQAQIYRIDSLAPNSRQVLENQLKDDSCQVLAAKVGGKIVGTAVIYFVEVPARGRSYAFLEGLVIDKNVRGKGYGRAFFNECVKIAHDKNCYKMIFTSGLDRQDAHKFYENLGFKKWGYEFRMNLD